MPARRLALGLLLGLVASSATATPITWLYTGHIDPENVSVAPILGVEPGDQVRWEVTVEPDTPDLHASSPITAHFDAVLSSVLSIGTGFRLAGGPGFITLDNDAGAGFDQFNLVSRLSGPILVLRGRPMRPDAAQITMQDRSGRAFDSDAFPSQRPHPAEFDVVRFFLFYEDVDNPGTGAGIPFSLDEARPGPGDAVIPEPSTIALVLSGLVAAGVRSRRKRSTRSATSPDRLES